LIGLWLEHSSDLPIVIVVVVVNLQTGHLDFFYYSWREGEALIYIAR